MIFVAFIVIRESILLRVEGWFLLCSNSICVCW